MQQIFFVAPIDQPADLGLNGEGWPMLSMPDRVAGHGYPYMPHTKVILLEQYDGLSLVYEFDFMD